MHPSLASRYDRPMQEMLVEAVANNAEPCAPAHGAHPLAHALAPLFGLYFEKCTIEYFLVAGVDAVGRLVAFHEWKGGAHAITGVTRPVLATLAVDGVDRIVIAHNHIDQHAAPTTADRMATRMIANLATLSGGHLADHVIHYGEGWVSLRAMGLID